MDNQDITYVVNHDQTFLGLPEYQTVLLFQEDSKVQITFLYFMKGDNPWPGTRIKDIWTLVHWRVQGTLKDKLDFSSEY